MRRRIAPMGRRSRAAACLALTVALTPALAMAQVEPDCGLIGPLAGPSLSTLIFDLPATSETSEIWAMLGYEATPIALPVRRVGPAQGSLILPLTLHHDTPETVETILIALDAGGELVWVCADLVLDLAPPTPDPGGTGQLAVRAGALAAQFEAALGTDPAVELAGLAGVPTGLRVLTADLGSLEGEIGPEDLARADATFGAVARALAAGDPPALPPGPPWRRNQAVKFFPAQIATTGPGTLANACPADPRQLTEYIDLGVRARINASADQQFLMTMGLTLFGASARLANAGLGGGRGVDRAIDLGATTLSTAQALMTDYLAGMMPLNLDRLEITHDPTLIPDDTPRENRLFRIHSAVLHTRSDGWSPDKATLDILLGLVSARTGGASGMGAGSVSSGLRRYGDDLVANSPLGQLGAQDIRLAVTHAETARRNLAVIERNAAALAQRRAAGMLPGPELLGSSSRHIEEAGQAYVRADIAAGTMLREAEEAAQAAQTAARLRGGADLLDMVGAPVLGNAEGQALGQLTGAIGAADMGSIGRMVSRCTVEMLRNGDGSRSRHLVFDVVEGDGEVLQVGLGDRIGFEVVGAGIRTARVRLNPALEYLPLTRQDILPEARVTVHVEQIQGRIDGLPLTVEPGSVHALTAWIGAARVERPLLWSVEPPMPLRVTDTERGRAADLTVPEDLPEGTLITVSVRAEGDFISASQVEPIWFAVAQVRSDDNEEEEDAALTCVIHDGNRLSRLSPELNIAQRYASDGFSMTQVFGGFCPGGSDSGDFVSSQAPDALGVRRTATGMVAWGELPVHRIAGLHRVEAMLEARNTCMPETARGLVRDWLAAEAGQVETYLLGSCETILLLGPERGLILDLAPFPGEVFWNIHYMNRQ